jgi:hypothetical protein
MKMKLIDFINEYIEPVQAHFPRKYPHLAHIISGHTFIPDKLTNTGFVRVL